MVVIEYPKWTFDFIFEAFTTIEKINKRLLPIETIHSELEAIGKSLKKLIAVREKFLAEENISVINLSTIVHSKTLSPEGHVYIKVNDIMITIGVHEGTTIKDDFTSYEYSIVKINNTQKIYYSCKLDALLHKIVTNYKLTSGNYAYRVGNRVVMKAYGGSYIISEIDHEFAMLTCKKWVNEGKGRRKVRLTEIKGLASNDQNYLTWKSLKRNI